MLPVIALAVTLLMAAPVVACPADCDGSGVVGIDELVLASGIVVANGDSASCSAGDLNDDGQIEVDELLTGIDSALEGCPAPPEVMAAAALSISRLMLRLADVSKAVSVAFDGAGGPTPCDLGGSLGDVCEDLAPGMFRSTVTTSDCRDDTRESTVAFDGTTVVSGLGQCPDVLIPIGLGFAFAWNMVNEANDGAVLLDSRMDVDLNVGEFFFGPSPCQIKGADVVLEGDLTYRTSDDREVVAQYTQTAAETRFVDFTETGCDPLRLSVTVSGPVHLRDMYGAGLLECDLELDGIVMMLDREAGTFTIDGTADGDCFGRAVRLTTIEPLDQIVGESCFSAGKLLLVVGRESVEVTVASDTSVQVDDGTDGIVDATFTSCSELPGWTGSE